MAYIYKVGDSVIVSNPAHQKDHQYIGAATGTVINIINETYIKIKFDAPMFGMDTLIVDKSYLIKTGRSK